MLLLLLSRSVVSDSLRPHRWQPTRLRRPWDSLGKITGVGCHFLLQCIKVKSEGEVAQSCPTLRPHESQHARPPCPSPTPGVHSNSCNLKSGRLLPPAPFFFFKTALVGWGLLCSHVNCEVFCSRSVKNIIGNLIGTTLNL